MHNSKKGSQTALFSDVEVRRDYLKSKQWVEQHMRIKVHLTGFACAYENISARPKNPDRPIHPGRYQGSLFSQQKHAIADAVEWIRLNSKYKPRIFVATTPGFLEIAKEGKFISKLVHNLKNGYGMENYVWVRELTKKGYPHFHFVADVDKFNPVNLSKYWAGLFGANAVNSIRLGTRPNAQGKRKFWIDTQRMCWYLTKYIGKSLGEFEKIKGVRRPRTFAISEQARKGSEPLLYQSMLYENFTGIHQREFFLTDEQIEPGLPLQVNPHNFSWRWTGHGQTYIGFRKEKN